MSKSGDGSGDDTGGKRGGVRAGERIAKVLARRGVASRRAVEAMIAEGRITVNGKVIDSPALNVSDRDRITVDGQPLPGLEPSRLWLYHKPLGLVTSEKDEKGRTTVFDSLPPELGRVLSVGRLDLNSEGLLLLTNDGALKRRLELPSTGWLRKYRVRVHGAPSEATLEPLRRGVTVEGERFLPMEVALDRQQGSNAWLTVGLREGRNREVRRAMEAVGLTVTRLIRISYGPFRLGELKPGEVEEVRRKVLRDQLGLPAAAGPEENQARSRPPAPTRAGRPATAGPGARKPGRTPKPAPGEAAPWAERAGGKPKGPRKPAGAGKDTRQKDPARGSGPAASRGDAPARGSAGPTAPKPGGPRGRGPKPGGPRRKR